MGKRSPLGNPGRGTPPPWTSKVINQLMEAQVAADQGNTARVREILPGITEVIESFDTKRKQFRYHFDHLLELNADQL